MTTQRARTALAVAVPAAFAIAAHLAIVEGLDARVGAVLSLVPLGFLLLWFARRSSRHVAAIGIAVAGIAAAWLAFPALESYFPSLFFIEHAGAQLVLAIVFGRTLAPGREPLVARFAHIAHGHLPPDVARYCRSVTIAWTVFFCVLFVLSCTLYLGGFLAAWSVLANILTPILVCAMFGVEYVVRYRVLPQWERIGVLGGIRAFSRHFGAVQPHSTR